MNPEAVAVTYNRGMFFGSGYAWMVQENYNNNSSFVNVDPTIFGAQAGLKFPLFGGETKVAAQYYDLTNGKGNAPFYNGNAFGNTTYARFLNGSTTATQVLLYDYEIFELSGEMGMTVADLPFSFWGDWAQNMASDVAAGQRLGARRDRSARLRTPRPGKRACCTSPWTRTRCSPSSSTPTSPVASRTPTAGCSGRAMRRSRTWS